MRIRQTILLGIGLTAALLCAALLFCSINGLQLVSAQRNGSSAPQLGPAEPTMPPADIVLPCALNGTNLIVEQLVQYEGAYMEDETYDEVINVAALLLRNCGDTVIADASVILQRGELQMCFEVSFLPPDTMLLVLEKDRKTCLPGNFTHCSGQVRQELSVEQTGDVSVSSSGKDTLRVENGAQRPLSIALYYKTVYGSGSFYMGGITHSVSLEHLEPGQTVELCPEYYSSICSEVVYIIAS